MIFKVKPKLNLLDWHEVFIWFPIRYSNKDEICWLEFKECKWDYDGRFTVTYRNTTNKLPDQQRSLLCNILRTLKLR